MCSSKFLAFVVLIFSGSSHAIDYTALKHNSILSFNSKKTSSIEIQYDQIGKGNNEKIQLFINNSLSTELTNKQKFIISVLPGSYNLEVRKGSNVLENTLKKTSGGQTLSWLIPHNKRAKEKAEVVISF
jgi:hypothetical protein